MNEVTDIVETIPTEDIALSGKHDELAEHAVPTNVSYWTGGRRIASKTDVPTITPTRIKTKMAICPDSVFFLQGNSRGLGLPPSELTNPADYPKSSIS